MSADTPVQEEIVEGEVVAIESDKEKANKLKEVEESKLKEYGGPVSFCKLFSHATAWELIIFLVGVIAAIATGAGQPLLCLFFGDLIDAVGADINQGADVFLDEVSRLSIIFVMIGVGITISGLLQGFCFGYFNELQVKKMRPLYFNALLYRDIGWFDTHEVGSLPTEMDEDLEVYKDGLGGKLGISIMSLSTTVCGYVFGLVLSWKVALVMTAMLPVMCVGVVMMGQSVMDVQQEKQGAYQQAAQQMDEVLFAVRTVVAFGGERKELRRYASSCDAARRGGIATRIRMGFGIAYIFAIFILSFALAFYFGMRLVYDGEDLSVGRMLAAFFCVITGGFTLGQAPPGLIGLAKARSSMARFFYITEHDAEIQRQFVEDRAECPPIENLAMEGVHFSYPARPEIKVLNGLDITITKGQKVAVVGESGSGKSTVMALLERFYDPAQGRVLVNGQDLRQFAVSSFRAQVGYVGQEPVLFATSVKDNIMQGAPNATANDVQRVAKYAQLDFIDRLPQQFETYVGSGGSQFSGGQKQRIAIARALIKNPSVLFLDEATSALDSTSEKMIQDTIDNIGSRSNLGMTIVSIAHRLSTIKNSDVIYVLKDGVVVEQGSHAELTAQAGGVYQGLAAAQAVALSSEAEEDNAAAGGTALQRQLSPKEKEVEERRSGGGRQEKLTEEQREKQHETEVLKTYKVPMVRLLNLARPEWWAFVPGLFCAFINGASFPVMAAYVIVDAMLGFMNPDREIMREDVEQACIWFVVIGVARFFATMGQFAFFAILGEAMTMRARVSMLTSVFRQEIGFHDNPEHTPARLVKALQLYAFRISNLVTTIGDTADGAMACLSGVVIGFINDWRMAGVMILSIPIFGVAQAIQISATMGVQQKEGGAQKDAAQLVTESLNSARTVHAAGNEKDIIALYTSLIREKGNALIKTSLISGFSFGLSQGVMFWVLAAGFWFMGWLISNEGAEFEDNMRAFLGIMYAGMGAGMAFSLTGDAGKAKVAAHDMFQLIDRQSAINGLEPDGAALAENDQIGRIEFKEVSFFYPFRPEVQVISKLSFSIEAGQSVGVVGPSGGGKSTVFAMMQRFYDPQSGSVLVGNARTPLDQVNVRLWRQKVGFVGQEPILFNTSVMENITGYTAEDGGEGVSAERLEQVKRMANLSFLDGKNAQGWDTQVGPRGSRLSGGQKQRVAIARALVRNPPILLLDEATSALDTQSEKVVSRALEAAREGRTSLAIAHRLSTIQDCDVILVVAEGVLVERGTHDELMEMEGVYFKLRGEGSGAADKKNA